MKKLQKRWMAAVLALLMLVVSIFTDAGLTANAATKKAKEAITVSIANLPENNTLYLNPGEESTYSYDFNAEKSGGLVYFEIKKDTNTAGVNSTKSGIVYPETSGSFEIRAVAFTSGANRTKWLNARKANGYVADPKAEKYIAAASDWATINVVTDTENEGIGVARNQSSLNKVLKNKKVKNVVIWTDAERGFTIASKNYKTKTLTVKAPNAEITNAGRFAQINVEQIKPSTFIEKAKGNRFLVSALNTRIIIERGARILGMLYQPSIGKADISVSTSFNFSLVVRGSIDVFNIAPQREADVTEEVKPSVKIEAEENSNINEVKISEPSDVTVAGEKESPVNLTVEESAAGTSLTAETPVKADLNADTSITLAESAKKSELTVSKKAEIEVKSAEEDKPVEDVTVKVAKEAEGAKIALFVKVVVEISANITLAGTAKEDSDLIIKDKDVTVTDENGNVIETETPDSENQGATGGDSTTSTPNIPAPGPSIPESDFSGKVMWSVGTSDSDEITKESQSPITIELSAEVVSGDAIGFSLYADDRLKYEVSADKLKIEGAETEVKVTVKSKEDKRVVAEYTIIFTIIISGSVPTLEYHMDNYAIADPASIVIGDMKRVGENEYKVIVTIPVAEQYGSIWFDISAEGYTTTRGSYQEESASKQEFQIILEGTPNIIVTICMDIGEVHGACDDTIAIVLQGDLIVTGSAVSVSGSAIIADVQYYRNGPQEMTFTTNADGSITGEVEVYAWLVEGQDRHGKLKMMFMSEIENKDVEYVWKKGEQEIVVEIIEDMEGQTERRFRYSVTIKAKK